MNIVLASDHRGYKRKLEIKKFLTDKDYKVIDVGTDSQDSVDFPDYAKIACKKVIDKEADLAILFCGTGIGMSIAANKVKGIRCAKLDNRDEAYFAKNHNNSNALAFSSKKSKNQIIKMLKTYLLSEFDSEEKYERRNKKIGDMNDIC